MKHGGECQSKTMLVHLGDRDLLTVEYPFEGVIVPSRPEVNAKICGLSVLGSLPTGWGLLDSNGPQFVPS